MMNSDKWPELGDVSYFLGAVVQRVGRGATEADLITARFNPKFLLDEIAKLGDPDELAGLAGNLRQLCEALEPRKPSVPNVRSLVQLCRAEWERVR